ncbi:MAG: transposase, partial [Bacteroidota bacterium]|nr:transposase [Bacteroidota bacterium]
TEKMERKYRLEAMGYNFDTIVERVSEIFEIAVKYILSPGKQPKRVMARSVLAYWAVRELGISGTKVGKKLGLSQPATSRAVQRGEQLVSEHRLSLYDTRNA